MKLPTTEKISSIIYLEAAVLWLLLISVVISRIVYPFDSGHLEAFSWMPAENLLQGKNPYSFALTPPYSMATYGVIFYALLAIGIKIFGFTLWWGRFLSVLSFIVCVWTTAKIIERLTGNRRAVFIGCVACAVFSPAQMWIALMRSDLIALAFSLSAFCLFFTLKKGERASFFRFSAIVLLSVAAFFTKQTFIFSTAVTALGFWQVSRWREGFQFCFAYVILTAGGMFFLNYTSGGGYLWQHFTHAQDLPFDLNQSLEGILIMLKTPSFVVFSIIFLVWVYQKRESFYAQSRNELIEKLRSPKLLILFYLCLTFFANSLSYGRFGSNLNYYLENSFLMAIVCGLIYSEFNRKYLSKTVLILFIGLNLAGIFQLARYGRGEYFRWQAVSYYREISETTAKFVSPGSVCLSIYEEIAVRNGCSFYFDDFAEYSSGWSPQLRNVFENEVQAGRFAVIIWKEDDFAEKFPNYKLIKMSQNIPERFPPVYLYVRKTDLSH